MILEEENDDIYYELGDYIYGYLKPEVSGNLDFFKYILGKFIIDTYFKI